MKGILGAGMVLTKMREKAGYNQKEFAKVLGTSQSTLCKIESNKRRVSLEMLERMATCLDYREESIILYFLSYRYPNLMLCHIREEVRTMEKEFVRAT
jgi:transcriptional regulator with XRE-family HTH domain